MADTTEGAPSSTPAAPAADLSLDAIVSEALSAAAAEGRDVMDGQPPKPAAAASPDDAPAPSGDAPAGDPAAEAPPAEGGAPAADAPAADPEPTAAEARRILAAAERMKLEASQVVQRATAELLEGLRTRPKATLAKLGLTVDDVIDKSLDEGDAPAPAKTEPQSDLEKRIARIEMREKELELNTARENVRTQIRGDKRFAAINAAGEHDTVIGFMESYFQKHGSPIPWAKAAQMVETQLRETATKVGTALGAFTAPKPGGAAAAPAARPGTSTLRNDAVRDTPPSADEDPTRDMSPDRAIAYLVEHSQ